MAPGNRNLNEFLLQMRAKHSESLQLVFALKVVYKLDHHEENAT
jgi:hypothetical protein